MKKNSNYVAACLLVVVFLLISLSMWASNAQSNGTSQQGTQVTELYTLLGAQKSRSAVSKAGVAEQEIEVAFDKIDFEKAANLRLPLLNSKAYDAVRRDVEGFERFSQDEFTWRGKIVGVDGSSGDVVLSVKGRALSGLIYSPEGVYEIIPQKDFKHLLVLLNQSLFAPCGGAIPAGAPRDRSEGLMSPAPAFDDGTQIDVLVAYTTAVQNSLGGTSQTQAFIQQAIASTNTAYQNSDISTRLRLVQTLHVDYSEGGTTSAALSWLATNADVAAARNSSKADLVAMLIEETSSGDCGVARVMRTVGSGFSEDAFSVTLRNCAVGNLTFAHELGHNEGCEHNPENGGSPSQASYPYAFGHYVDGVFRTVMSYVDPCPSGCTRQPYFSNPSINFSGFATGIANQRDNHRAINNTALIVSQFRDSGSVSCPSTSVNIGQTLNGSLTSSDCVLSGTTRAVDFYSFSGSQGQQILASMNSSAFDTYLYLTNSANQVLAEDNNSGPGSNSRVPASGFFTLPSNGTYFLWASSATNSQTGAYSVSLSECAFSISSSGTSVGPGNGAGNFLMDTSSGCNWSAVSDSTSWLTTSSSGSGDGTVSYNFSANPGTSSRTGRITVGGQVFTVTQIGIGGAGGVQLSTSTYSVNENATTVTITVTRNGVIETGTVQYSTANGTATAGSDYTAASGTLLFGENETSKSFTVTILDDTASESSESFSVSLKNPSLSFTLGTPITATVTIVDNDALLPPTANAASSITSNSFIANWSSSSGATGYRMDMSTDSAFSSFVSGYQNLDVGNTLSRSISDLTASKLYYYRLRAYNLSSTTASSNTIIVSTTGPMIFVEQSLPNRAAALDSVTWLRGPFRLLNLFNFSTDHRTRVMLFTSDLGLSQPDPSQLTVQAGGVNLSVERVGPVPGVAGMSASYIIVRLPDGLPAGDLPLVVMLRGLASVNSPTLSITP